MAPNRFAVIGKKKIFLFNSEEEWIEIKDTLNVGDQKRQDALAIVPAVVKKVNALGILEDVVVDRTDWGLYEILRAELWLLSWHIHDAEGNVPPLNLDSIKALDAETFNEITVKIFDHIMEVQNAKLEAKKKAMKTQLGLGSEATST